MRQILDLLGELAHDFETLAEDSTAGLRLAEGLDCDLDASDVAQLLRYAESAARVAQYLPGMVANLAVAVDEAPDGEQWDDECENCGSEYCPGCPA